MIRVPLIFFRALYFFGEWPWILSIVKSYGKDCLLIYVTILS